MKSRPTPVYVTVTMNFLYCYNRVKYKGPFPRSLDILIDLAGNYINHNTGQVFHVIVFNALNSFNYFFNLNGGDQRFFEQC